MKYISKLASIVFVVLFVSILAPQVDAGSYIGGHAYMIYEGRKVYLEGVQVEWKITWGGAGGCNEYNGSYRTVRTGSPISYLTLVGGNPSGLPSSVDCRNEQMGYGDTSPSCITNSRGQTIDVYNNVNYVFARQNCFGCQLQQAEVTPSLPSGYGGLPGGLNPNYGIWKLDPFRARGLRINEWRGDFRLIQLNNINDSDEFDEIDFEWIPLATINGRVSGRCENDGDCSPIDPTTKGVDNITVDLERLENNGRWQRERSTRTNNMGQYSFSDLGYNQYRVSVRDHEISSRNLAYTSCDTEEGRKVNFNVDTQGGTNAFTRNIFLYSTVPYPPGNRTFCPTATGAQIETKKGDVYSGGGYNFTKGFVRGKKLAEYLVTGDRRWNFATPLSESMHEWTVKSYPMTALYKKYTYSYFWENVGKKILPESNKSVTVHGDLTQDVLNNLGGVASNRPIVRLIPQVASTTIRTSSTSIVFDKEVLIAFIGSDINKVHLEINNNIEVAPGAQLVFIVSGNVRLSKNVTRLDGIYIIDGQLVDLYDWVPGDESPYQKQLFGEGSIMTWGGFDLGNTGGRYREFPHEATYQFTFAPKYLVMISELLGERDYLWAEINP